MRLTRFSLLLAALALVPGVLPAPAAAQFENPDAGPEKISFGPDNPQLQKLLRLQYQMQVLRQLIRHEQVVNKMVETSIGLGELQPTIARPDRQMCLDVPANIPCAQAYDGAYENYSVEKIKPLVAIPASPAAPPPKSLVAGSDVPSLEAAALPELPDASLIPSGSTLYWTDITCMGATCTAVITPTPGDSKARYRVNTGETLPDGAVISAISAAGVSITRGKKTISLEPAPKA